MPDKDLTNNAEDTAPGLAAEGRKHQDSRTDETHGAAFGPPGEHPRAGDDDAATAQPQPNRGMSVGQTKIGPLNDPND